MDTIETPSNILTFIEQNHSLELYAIINGASFEHFERTLYEIEPDPEFRSLLMGTESQELRNIVPYLVKLTADSPFFQYLNTQNQMPWGYFSLSSFDFDSVFEHYQQALFASCCGMDRIYFFFYQPRIAFAYCYHGVDEQIKHFMGPVNYLLIPNYKHFLLNEPHPYAVCYSNPAKEPQMNQATRVVISDNQIQAFERVTERNFIQKMIAQLSSTSEQYKQWTIKQKVNFIEYGIERCRIYKITSHNNMANYLEMMLIYGHRFDEMQTSWATDILNNTDLKGSEKVTQLLAYDNAISRLSANE